MTDVEQAIEHINIQDYREQRERDAAWQELAEQIAKDEVAITRFRDLMNTFVGAPDPEVRGREGLPIVTASRYGEELQYTQEVCAMINETGSVVYVRAVDNEQRWSEETQDWYSTEAIFERGKNFFVVEGSLLGSRGLKQSVVGQHHSFISADNEHHYHRLQAIPPEGFNQPFIPLHGSMTDLPWTMRIERTPSGTAVHYDNDPYGPAYRPIDGTFVDMVATARAQYAPALDTLAS